MFQNRKDSKTCFFGHLISVGEEEAEARAALDEIV